MLPCPQNPFGAAKPREAVLAQRTGKAEEEILKEAVLAEKVRVSASAGCTILVTSAMHRIYVLAYTQICIFMCSPHVLALHARRL